MKIKFTHKALTGSLLLVLLGGCSSHFNPSDSDLFINSEMGKITDTAFIELSQNSFSRGYFSVCDVEDGEGKYLHNQVVKPDYIRSDDLTIPLVKTQLPANKLIMLNATGYSGNAYTNRSSCAASFAVTLKSGQHYKLSFKARKKQCLYSFKISEDGIIYTDISSELVRSYIPCSVMNEVKDFEKSNKEWSNKS